MEAATRPFPAPLEPGTEQPQPPSSCALASPVPSPAPPSDEAAPPRVVESPVDLVPPLPGLPASPELTELSPPLLEEESPALPEVSPPELDASPALPEL